MINVIDAESTVTAFGHFQAYPVLMRTFTMESSRSSLM